MLLKCPSRTYSDQNVAFLESWAGVLALGCRLGCGGLKSVFEVWKNQSRLQMEINPIIRLKLERFYVF